MRLCLFLIKKICIAYNKSFPFKRLSRKRAKDKPWITSGLKQSIKQKHALYQKCKFENRVTKNDVIMMSLPKTMENNGKMQTSVQQNKIHIIGKVLMRAIQKCNFY